MYLILSQCQPPISILYSTATLHLSPIHLTHFLSKQLLIPIYIMIHLPSKLFICLHFALINLPFNLSLFFNRSFLFVNLQTSFFCNFIPSIQYLLPRSLLSFNCNLYTTSFHHTFFGLFPPPSLSHTPLLNCQPLLVSPAPTLGQHSAFILFLFSRHLAFHSIYCRSRSFSLLILFAPIRHLSSLNVYTNHSNFTQYNMII